MSDIHGRITYSAEDIQRIKAASFHDVPVKAETPAQPVLFKEARKVDTDGNPYIMLWKGSQVVYVCHDKIFCRLGNMKTPEQVTRGVAMLTRAYEIMQEGK